MNQFSFNANINVLEHVLVWIASLSISDNVPSKSVMRRQSIMVRDNLATVVLNLKDLRDNLAEMQSASIEVVNDEAR